MTDQILETLTKIESENDVKVLYACESGSRAWGFASTDSDYDVRFIYKHKPDWYLQIDEKRDVIELPIDEVLDVNGWDIKKALKLFRNSNAPLYEWLQSPIVYQKEDGFITDISALMHSTFSLRSGLHHYLSMTANTYNNSLQEDMVRLKKYFYALRPLFAAMWIAEKRELPPMEFYILRTVIDDSSIQASIDELLERKIAADEKSMIAPITLLHNFIGERLKDLTLKGKEIDEHNADTDAINNLFRNIIREL